MQRFLIPSFVIAALVAAAPASAQTFQPRKARPEWGIFASGVSKTEQRLVLTATFGGGYEDDLSKAPAAPPDGLLPTTPVYSGPFGSAGASLTYNVDRKKVAGSAGFSASGRNYGDMSEPFVGTYSADTGLSFVLGKNGNLSTSLYAGQYLQNLAPTGYDPGTGWGNPGIPQVPGMPGSFTTGDTYRAFGASASYQQKLTTKFSVSASWAYYANDSWSSTTVENARYGSQYVSAGMRYALGKGFGVRAGYGTTIGGFGSDVTPNYRNRSIDAGIDYNKSLSLTRKSTLSFNTGLSGVLDQVDETHYYFVGNANYTYELGRSWDFHASVNRDTSFYQTLGRPTINDWISTGVSGLIGRRLEVSSGISAWKGSAIGTEEKVYDSASAYAGMRVGLSRIFAVSANYSYYRYGFTNNVLLLPPGFVRQTDRQTIQVSLVVWAPLMARAPAQSRSANASR